MGLFDFLFSNTTTDNNEINDEDDVENVSPYDDAEIDSYGLDEDEKKLVKEGVYDPWEFEEEDTDEDDYYAEDDI